MSLHKSIKLFSFALLPTLASLPVLASSACVLEDEEGADEGLRMGELGAEFVPPSDPPLTPYLIVTRPDPTECLVNCGGWYVKWLDADSTLCADESWQDECHVYELDLSIVAGKSESEVIQTGFGSRDYLVRGELVEVETKSGMVDRLVVSEALAPVEVAIGPAGGSLEVDEGPLAGLSIEVPPGAVEEVVVFSAQLRDRAKLTFTDPSYDTGLSLFPDGRYMNKLLAALALTHPGLDIEHTLERAGPGGRS